MDKEQLEAVKNLKKLIELLIKDLNLTMLTTSITAHLVKEISQNCCNDVVSEGKTAPLFSTLEVLQTQLETRLNLYSHILEKGITPKWQELNQKHKSLDLSPEELMALDDLKDVIDLLKKKGLLLPDFLQ